MTATHSQTTSQKSNDKIKVPYAEKKAHLDKLLDHFKTAFLVSHAKPATDEHFHARPMGVLDHDDNGDLWFATALDSNKIEEITADPKVLVTMQDDRRFVCVTGRAVIVRDRRKIDELWSPALEVWFPKGKDDPNLALLRVDASEATFWDNSGTKGLKYLFQAAAALITGTRPEGQETEKDTPP